MGFYIRKSFKIGPLRLNLSKSGLGASVGTKGARLGLSAKGKLYTHLGRSGLYHRQDLGSLNPGAPPRRRVSASGSSSPSAFCSRGSSPSLWSRPQTGSMSSTGRGAARATWCSRLTAWTSSIATLAAPTTGSGAPTCLRRAKRLPVRGRTQTGGRRAARGIYSALTAPRLLRPSASIWAGRGQVASASFSRASLAPPPAWSLNPEKGSQEEMTW